MANRRVISIDVETHDESFKQFAQLFQQYSDKVEELPDSWKHLDEAMSEAGAGFNKTSSETHQILAGMATQTHLIVEAIKQATSATDDFGRSTTAAAKNLKEMEVSSAAVGANVIGIGAIVSKLGGTGGFSTGVKALLGLGAAAVGGLVVAEKTSEGVMSTSRQAGGMGISIGQLKAFQNNLGQYVGNGILGGVANAQIDLQQRGTLDTLVGPAEANNSRLSAAQVTEDATKAALREFTKTGNDSGAKMQAYRQLGGDPADIRYLASLSNKERSDVFAHTMSDAQKLNTTPKAAEDWRDLDRTLLRAKGTIEASLINNLAPLTGDLVGLAKKLAPDASLLTNLGTFAAELRLASEALKILIAATGVKSLLPVAARGAGAAAAAEGAGAAAADVGIGMLGVGGAALAAGLITLWPSHLGKDDLGASGADLKKRRDAIGILSAEYKKAGLGNAAISGLLGNGMWEGGLDPHRAQAGGGPGFGIYQWEGPRQADFAKLFGHSMQTATTEEEGAFSIWEMKNKYPKVWAQLQSGKLDVQQATRLVEHDYLAPKDKDNPTGSIIHRTAMAQQMAAILQANTVVPIGMGRENRSAGVAFNPGNHNELVGLLKTIAANTAPVANKAAVTVTNNSSARVHVSANAAGR